MLSIILKRDQLPELFALGKTEAKNALFRATLQTTNQTANQAAKLIGRETNTTYRAILRGFKVTLPRKNAADMKGTIHARTGDFIPLAGSRTRIRFIEKVPKNYRETKTVRRYQLIAVKLFGKDNWTEIKGAFRAQLIGGNQKKIAEAKKEAAKTGGRVPGRRHAALLMRRSDKRLPLRELFTNQPDMALYLNKYAETIQTYAQKTLDTKIGEEIKFRQIRQVKKKLK
jgi:hypothetical protein